MNITLTCTKNEACSLIKEYKTEVDNVIITDATSTYNYVESILRVTRFEYPNASTNGTKIEAIKRLRTLVDNLGLYEAKIAVERPLDAIDYYLKTGKVYNG